MQRRSLRFYMVLVVVGIVACIGTSLKNNRIPSIQAKISSIVTESLLTKTAHNPTKIISAKIPHTSTKYAIKRVDEGSIDTVWFDDALPAGANANADDTQVAVSVGLKNKEGFYVTAVNGGRWEVNLNPSGTKGTKESFRLVDLNGGTLESGDSIRLLAQNGTHYLSTHGGGAGSCDQPNGQVFANATEPGAWETFVISKADGSTGTIGTGGQVSLKSSGGFYFWSEQWSGSSPPPDSPLGNLYANRTTIGNTESFALQVSAVNTDNAPTKVGFRSSGSFYISAVKGSGWEVNVNQTTMSTDQTFDVVDLNGGQLESGDQVRFKKDNGACGVGYYLSIYGGGAAQGTPPPNGRAYMKYGTPSNNETFTIVKSDGNSGVISQGTSISMRTENGYYFCAEGGGYASSITLPLGRLYANRNSSYVTVGDREKFTIELTTTGGGGEDESWNWIVSNPSPQSGTKAHQSSIASGRRQHYFTDATQTMPVSIGDKLFTWVYLDPANMPSEIMLQWNDGTNFEHRAYWGANNIDLGTDGTVSRKYMGGLPVGGSWVKLDVPASAVGLEGKTVNGMAFTQYGGRVTWDKSGKSKALERVIVKLNVPYTLEAQLPGDTERQAQRNRIIQAQDALLSSLTDYYPDSVKRFDLAPYLGLVVGSTGYQMLQTSQYVSAVSEDKLMAPATAENLTIVGAPLAWNQNKTGAGQTIVVLDTGIDKNHPALLNKVKAEACFSAFDENAEDLGLTSLCPGGGKFSDLAGSGVNCPLATCEHGTQVAGAAAGNNATDNYYGVARGANLISIQIFSKLDNSDVCPTGQSPCAFAHQTDQMRALEYVYRQKTESNGKYKDYNIAAVNVSVTGLGTTPGDCSDGNSTLSFIKSLRSIGIPVITPSGDDSNSGAMSEPACMPDTISVGATGGTTDTANSILPLSNSISFLKLLSPGGTIYAPIPGTGYNTTSGTSLAAAHVSGAWAVLKQQDPNASVDKILKKLRNNGVWITDQRNNLPFPRFDIVGALSCLQNVDSAQTWRGEYYDNKDLSGDPVMIRDDSSPGQHLDKDMNDGSITSPCGPGTTGVFGDGISIRWTRTVNLPTTNRYGFSVTSDKDVRFYVDGIEKTNMWETIAGTKTYIVDNLPSGNHVLKLEYRTSQAAATQVKLSWSVPPATPTNLAASVQSISQINLTWTSNSDSNTHGFLLERSTDGGNTFPWNKDVGKVVNYADLGLSPATTYTYRIRAYNSIGISSYSNISSAATLPDAPSNLTASAVSSSRINLIWSNNSGLIHGYRIYRNGGKIAEVGAGQTSYADSGLTPNTTYIYQITAYNTSGESSYSNQSSAMTWRPIPAAPTNLQLSLATGGGNWKVTLTWNDNSPYEDGFEIERREIQTGSVEIIRVGPNITSYIDIGRLPIRQTYQFTYQVKAYNNSGMSNPSNSVGVETPCADPNFCL